MSKCLFVKFEDCKHLDHASSINSPLVIIRNVDISGKSHSDGYSLLGYDTSASDLPSTVDLAASRLPNLNYFIVEICVADLITSDLTECIDRSDVLVLDIKPDFYLSRLRRNR